MTNPYEILGVKSDAGKSEIDAAYNRLITEYKNSGSSDKIQELTTAYNQAVNQYNDSIDLTQISAYYQKYIFLIHNKPSFPIRFSFI